MELNANFFGLCVVLSLLMYFPLFFQLIYTAVKSTTPDEFVRNQHEINLSVMEYFGMLGNSLETTFHVILKLSGEATTTITLNTIKISDTLVEFLDATATLRGLMTISFVFVSYGFLFQYVTIRDTFVDLVRPVVEMVQEVWRSFKQSVRALWNSLDSFYVIIFSTFICVVIIQVALKYAIK